MDTTNKENFKKEVKRLTEQFSSNKEYYESSKYKEDQLRQEFINPFFNALGWDMDNKQGFAPQYREVIHEDRIEIEGKPKAPDYAFKVGSNRKFFVEAKASSVKVFTEIEPAFQLRRYAWSSSLPVSILTDFQEFSVYDTTLEPKHKDKASVARIKYIGYEDYLKEIDYLWDTFSKEAVWKGSFDKFATKEKKGSQLVDKSFLKEIELWRELLAKDIASNNDLDLYELNFVVQKLIDRFIFLRIAEDRGIENYENLRKTIESSDTYSELLRVFKRADDKYDSSLFDFKTDELSPKIKVSDKVLDRILGNLYYPKSPYEFSVIGVDILGSVYEQFLGKVVRLTRGGNAVIEEKPEVKKAGGVYYTPQYIVQYIINNTIGELVEGKTPREVAKLKIVDPACGSGSFLIGAYNYLLDWHLKYYIENEPDKHVKSKKLFKDSGGNYYLSSQEKKEILLNNIYGVDIDTQAVEVTKLSLALKMLEDENSETIGAQFILFAERILPDLRDNIKCGNSLIGSDYFSDKQISLLGDEEIRKVNAFDWEKEFPEVFKDGGFDAIIGNPPYIKEATEKEAFIFKEGALKKYYQGKMDIWYAFACFSIDLLKDNGLLSFIATNNWLTNSGASILREKILEETRIKKYVDFSDFKVFTTASIQTMIFVLSKEKPSKGSYTKYTKVLDPKISLNDLSSIISGSRKLDIVSDKKKFLWFNAQADITAKNGYIIFVDQNIGKILQQIKSASTTFLYSEEVGNGIDVLQDFVNKRHLEKLPMGEFKVGDGVFVLSKDEVSELSLSNREEDILKPYYTGSELSMYYKKQKSHHSIIYADKHFRENISKFPNLKKHLDKYRKIMTSAFKPYGLHRTREQRLFEGEKILCLRKTRRAQFTYSNFPCYVSRAFMIIKTDRIDNIFLTGLLNSSLINFWLYYKGKKQGDQLQVDKAPILEIPIAHESESNEIEKIKDLTEKILSIGKEILDKNISSKKVEVLKEQEKKYRKEIDRAVYNLYELEEKAVEYVEVTNS